MKLEIGMYVRTDKGLIAKYTGYEKDEENTEYNKYKFNGKIYWHYEYYNDYVYEEDFQEWFEKKVIKVSHNIIDLIEAGDYVNGYSVYEILEYKDNTRAIVIGDDNKSIIWEESSQYIKSIVTKEQFESMSYKVGE